MMLLGKFILNVILFVIGYNYGYGFVTGVIKTLRGDIYERDDAKKT